MRGSLFGVVWVFAPVLGALVAHAPVLIFDLFPRLKIPIDRGATVRGRRVFGDNKTWRGALTMCAGVVIATLLLARWPAYWALLPVELQRTTPALLGMLLGLGTVLAELPNSFVKRQLDVPPGRQHRSPLGVALAVFDQGDFVFGIWLLLAPIWVMSAAQAAAAFVTVVAVHMVANVIGYLIGARTNPL